MSDSEKLRKKQGDIWLTASFVCFTLAVCGVWSIFVTSWGIFMMGAGILPIFLFVFSFFFAKNSCETYIGVSEKEISKSASAQLRKTTGMVELFYSFIFLALTISCAWVLVVFANISTAFLLFVIPLALCFSGFMIHTEESYKNFMAIKDLVTKK